MLQALGLKRKSKTPGQGEFCIHSQKIKIELKSTEIDPLENFLESAGSSKRSKTKRMEVRGIFVEGKTVSYMLEDANSDIVEKVERMEAHQKYPQAVIEYYEKHYSNLD